MRTLNGQHALSDNAGLESCLGLSSHYAQSLPSIQPLSLLALLSEVATMKV